MLSAQNPMLSAKNPMLSANSDVGPPMSTDRYPDQALPYFSASSNRKKEREREKEKELWWRKEKSPMLSAKNPILSANSDVGPKSSADVIEHDSEGLT